MADLSMKTRAAIAPWGSTQNSRSSAMYYDPSDEERVCTVHPAVCDANCSSLVSLC